MAFNFLKEIIYLGSKTASASSTLDFTTGISSNFTNYLIKARNVYMSTNGQIVKVRFSTDGGSTFISSNYKSRIIQNGTTLDQDTDSNAININSDVSSTAARAISFDVTLYNLSNSQIKSVYTYSGAYQAFNNVMATRNSCGIHTGTTAVNALRILTGSGTITSGTFYLYGIQEP